MATASRNRYLHFYPRSPCGERRETVLTDTSKCYFYPRSPCGERQSWATRARAAQLNFYPRSPCGERHSAGPWPAGHMDFYPRSPCGERRYPHQRGPRRLVISIHALLAESDKRPAQMLGMTKQISIHALLAESDWQSARRGLAPGDFYPRSPCGERRRRNSTAPKSSRISIHALLAESDLPLLLSVAVFGCYFYPRSPCGERPSDATAAVAEVLFLSTLSLRRATQLLHCPPDQRPISIHALLAESDDADTPLHGAPDNFYPRSPCGERRAASSRRKAGASISIHALLAESDILAAAGLVS